MVFGLFGSKEEKEKKRIRDLAKRAGEKFGDPSARTKAMEGLRDVGTPEAISALMQRFTFKIDPGITDAEEKDYAFSMVTSFGEKAVAPVKDFVRKQDSVSWGLRCLDALVPADEVVTTLVEVLDKLAKEYTRDPDKKVLLVNHLANHKDPRVVPAVLPFLDDAFDDVRLSALATLTKQGDAAAAGPIAKRILEDEAVRVRAAAAAALAELGAPVDADADALAKALPDGFALKDGRVVRR